MNRTSIMAKAKMHNGRHIDTIAGTNVLSTQHSDGHGPQCKHQVADKTNIRSTHCLAYGAPNGHPGSHERSDRDHAIGTAGNEN